MKVLFVTSEVFPIVKVGGLADVSWALPQALLKLGVDVRVLVPEYGEIGGKGRIEKSQGKKAAMVVEGLKIPKQQGEVLVNIRAMKINGHLPVYLLENEEYFGSRSNVYGYRDDPRRWALLSLGALEFIRRREITPSLGRNHAQPRATVSGFIPDVIHCHDWMGGLLPDLLKTKYVNDKVLQPIASVFTIHNLENQGPVNARTVSELVRDDGSRPVPDLLDPALLQLSFMRRGIIYSDLITTVSPTYAAEILEPEFGAGLDKLLREVRTKVFGVINGLDSEVFDPARDADIFVNYNRKRLDKKVENKLAFQKQFGLEVDKEVPLVGFVGRFYSQKGVDLVLEAIDKLMATMNLQFAFVGAGEPQYERGLYKLQSDYKRRVVGHMRFDRVIAAQIYAGADILVHPSRFEPCGQAQLIAMRYGCIPVVRNTGGLADTVKDFNPGTGIGTGFVFDQYEPEALMICLTRALTNYQHQKVWRQLMRRAMSEDFSWLACAKRFAQLYAKARVKKRQWLVKKGLVRPKRPEELEI